MGPYSQAAPARQPPPAEEEEEANSYDSDEASRWLGRGRGEGSMLGKVTPKLILGWDGNGVLDSIDAPSPLTCGPSKTLWFRDVLGKGLLPSASQCWND